jgi:hypothetical protein
LIAVNATASVSGHPSEIKASYFLTRFSVSFIPNTQGFQESYLPVYTRHWDDQVKVPWLYDKQTEIMISYEDPESIAVKAKYVIQKHLGGMMFWDLLVRTIANQLFLTRSIGNLRGIDVL